MTTRSWQVFWFCTVLSFLFSALLARYGIGVQDTEYYLWQMSQPDYRQVLVLQPASACLTQLVWTLSFGSLYILRLWMLLISFGVVLTLFTFGTRQTPQDALIALITLLFVGLLTVYIFDSAYWAMHWMALIALFAVRYACDGVRSARWWLGLCCGALVVSRPPSSWICLALVGMLLLSCVTSREAFKQVLLDCFLIGSVATVVALLFVTWYAGSPLGYVTMVLEKLQTMPSRYSTNSLWDSYANMLFRWAWLPASLMCLLCVAFRRFVVTKKWGLFLLAFVAFIHLGRKVAKLTPELQALGVIVGVCIVVLILAFCLWEESQSSWRERIPLFFVLVIAVCVTMGSDSWPSRSISNPLLLVFPLLLPQALFGKERKAKYALLGISMLALLILVIPMRRKYFFREGGKARVFSSRMIPVAVPGYAGLLTTKENAAWYHRMETLSMELHKCGYQISALGSFGCIVDFLCLQKGIATVSSTEFWRNPNDIRTKHYLKDVCAVDSVSPTAFVTAFRRPDCRWADWRWNKSGVWPKDYKALDNTLRSHNYRLFIGYLPSESKEFVLGLPATTSLEEMPFCQWSMKPLFR